MDRRPLPFVSGISKRLRVLAGDSVVERAGAYPRRHSRWIRERRGVLRALHRWLLQKTMAVPVELASVRGLDNCVYLTLRFLLQARSLSFISVWNTSFLPIILKQLELHGERLARDLLDDKVSVRGPLPWRITNSLKRDAGQARNLRAMLGRGRIEPEVLWPRLELISCWTSAASAAMKSEIQSAFPGVAIQGKGLLATEGVISIPIERHKGCVAAVTSHFLEFLDLGSGACRLVSELERGTEYSVVLTTGGGFWRYKLGDRIRVTGFAGRTPVLEFIGKDDCVSDLRGEKLNAIFVAKVLEEFECCRSAAFAMVAPCDRGIPGYILFLESGHCETELASRLDEKLGANPHYAYCRRLGQLAEPRVFTIQQGAREAFLKHCEALGQRAGKRQNDGSCQQTGRVGRGLLRELCELRGRGLRMIAPVVPLAKSLLPKSRFEIKLANDADDHELRGLLRRSLRFPGSISVTCFERDPTVSSTPAPLRCARGFFSGWHRPRSPHRELSSVLGTRSVSPAFVNGRPALLGYLADLRLDERYRGGTLIARGYRFLRHLHEDHRARLYTTMIFSGNHAALTTIASGRAGLPQYHDMGLVHSPGINIRRAQASRSMPVVRSVARVRRTAGRDCGVSEPKQCASPIRSGPYRCYV